MRQNKLQSLMASPSISRSLTLSELENPDFDLTRRSRCAPWIRPSSLRSMETEERKARAEIKKLAKLGQTQNVRVVAQQLVRTKAAKEKIQFGKAQLGSVMMQMNNQLAMMKYVLFWQMVGE